MTTPAMIDVRPEPLLVIDAALVEKLLPEERLQSLMAAAFRAVSANEAGQSLRQILPLPAGDGRCLSLMPGFLPDGRSMGAKLTAVMPGNHRIGLQSHRGVVILFAASDGTPLALLHGGEITGRRTASATAVATELLARQDAVTMTILGTGEQAFRHLRALANIRRWRDVRIWGRRADAAAAVARAAVEALGLPIRVVADPAEAVAGAHVVTSVTGATDPVLFGHWAEPGMHFNLVGSSTPDCREADDTLVERARCFADSKAMLAHAGGEWRHALANGTITEHHLAGEIGDVLNGTIRGRTSANDITLFKSLGMPAQDLFAAEELYLEATRNGCGQKVFL